MTAHLLITQFFLSQIKAKLNEHQKFLLEVIEKRKKIASGKSFLGSCPKVKKTITVRRMVQYY